MPRKRIYDTLERISAHGPYDEYPVLPAGTDPQLCVSRNDRPQPFHLVTEFDTVLAVLYGSGHLDLRESPVSRFSLAPGDFVYVPGGVPHRMVPDGEMIVYRYRAEHPGLEATAWFCDGCGAAIHRETWDTAEMLPQEGYLQACEAFNVGDALRRCRSCGEVHPPVDLAPTRWAEIAAELRADADAPRPGPAARAGAPRLAPRDDKEPMKVNVYWFARVANTQLAPLFPYLAPGSIVPCVSLHSSAGGHMGHFVHVNTVDEVVVNFGAVNSYVPSGQARVGTKKHGVGSKTPPPPGPESSAINVITQRHPFGVRQDESIAFVCSSCNHELSRLDYDGNPPPGTAASIPDLPTLSTILNSATAADTFNGSADLQRCPECGAANGPFPLENWGWADYSARTETAVVSRRALLDAAGAALRQRRDAAE